MLKLRDERKRRYSECVQMNVCDNQPKRTILRDSHSRNIVFKAGSLADACNDLKKAFGAAVRCERVRQRLSQESLAERADLHRTYITDVERGVRNISIETICKLANALEISIASLIASSERH